MEKLKIVISLMIIASFVSPKLQFVMLLSRHGARDIEYTYIHLSDDPRIGRYPLELTETGVRELFVMGVEMGSRYIKNKNPYFNILNYTYNPYQIKTRVVTSNRTSQSGFAFLNGLYPSGTGPILLNQQRTKACPPINNETFCSKIDQELNDNALPNQTNSIPVINSENVGKESSDYVSRHYYACQPLWDYNRNMSLLSYKASVLNKDFRDVFDFLYQEWGLNEYNDLLKVIEFDDDLHCVEAMGAPLVKPINEEMKVRLSNASLQSNLYELIGRKESTILVSYFFINFIIEDLKSAFHIITDSSINTSQKFRFSGIFYSDIHIEGLIRIMHLEDQIPQRHIPYASNFIFEV